MRNIIGSKAHARDCNFFLRHLPPTASQAPEVRPVIYVHGATFPSALSIAHRFDGYSWRDALCDAGFDVWSFDFLGYGYSDRYPEMSEPAGANSALCRAQDGSEQLEAAVRFILQHLAIPSLSIISHSWASMPTCRFAGRHPTMVDRIVLFAPIARRAPRRYEGPPPAPAWRFVTIEDQWARFVEDVVTPAVRGGPAGDPLTSVIPVTTDGSAKLSAGAVRPGGIVKLDASGFSGSAILQGGIGNDTLISAAAAASAWARPISVSWTSRGCSPWK